MTVGYYMWCVTCTHMTHRRSRKHLDKWLRQNNRKTKWMNVFMTMCLNSLWYYLLLHFYHTRTIWLPLSFPYLMTISWPCACTWNPKTNSMFLCLVYRISTLLTSPRLGCLFGKFMILLRPLDLNLHIDAEFLFSNFVLSLYPSGVLWDII